MLCRAKKRRAELRPGSQTYCFWPDEPSRLERLHAIAQRLGTTLEPPRLSWKYAPIRAVWGWKAAKRASSAVNSAKVRARLQLERFSLAAPKR